MQILISRNGQQFGPFSQDEVWLKVKTGELTLNDWGWTEGMNEWKSLQIVLADIAAGSSGARIPAAVVPTDKKDSSGTIQIALPKGISKMSSKFSPPKP